MEIINFKEKLLKKENDLFYKDHLGEIWYPFSFKYILGNREFSLEAWARSEDEARGALLDAIRGCEFEHQILRQAEATPDMIDGAINDPSVTWVDAEEIINTEGKEKC